MIKFPDWVRPVTPCRTRTFTRGRRSRHGWTWETVTVKAGPNAVVYGPPAAVSLMLWWTR